jgi:hypothetical protein
MADATTTAATAETTETTTETTQTEQQTQELGDAGKAALEAERKARRDAEKAAKAATAELDKLRQATATDQEKAVMAAKAEGRTEALREAGTRLVEAEVRAAAAGRGVDIDALLEGVDRSKFLDDEGEPDRKLIQEWIDRIVPAQEEQEQPGFRAPNLEQGTRTTTANTALNGDPLLRDLKSKLGIR